MDKATLEGSIREESARVIAEIKKKESLEMKRMEEICASEIETFRKQVVAETEARLQQELSKLSNKAILERRKLKLLSLETFVNRMVDEVVKALREAPHYKRFVLDAVCAAAGRIPGGVEVRLKAEDLPLKQEILASVGAAGRSQGVVIREDPTLKWGGCLVLDEAGARIFNSTIERIYFRKSPMIRERVMKILMDHSNRGEGPHPPAV